MARALSINVQGLKDLQKKMLRVETSIEPRDVNPLIARALKLIEKQAIANLKGITARAENLPEGWEHIEDAFLTSPGKSRTRYSGWSKIFRAKAPQAIWIEFGHRIVGHRPGLKSKGRMVRARPFFRPAVDSMRKQVRAMIEDGIKKLIERASKYR